ncbi:MAG: hypothetical protein A4E32_01542 [Methanomassiliicoccales archaeon PtaU1.Bin124]|nr:MAG: hypothetical protein A4E32_01542 [Methanomassiliicoccales archaeon PtaU1.Bin124]
MNENAIYCDHCGAKRIDHQGVIVTGEMVRSTKIYVSQSLLVLSVIFIGMGLMMMLFSMFVPNVPFFDDFRAIPILMGLIMIGIGVAIFFIGRRNQ